MYNNLPDSGDEFLSDWNNRNTNNLCIKNNASSIYIIIYVGRAKFFLVKNIPLYLPPLFFEIVISNVATTCPCCMINF